MKFVVDTNVLLQSPEVIEEVPSIITSIVLREIESLERRRGDKVLQYQVREAKRAIERAIVSESVDTTLVDYEGGIEGYDKDYADNAILSYAESNGHGILTNDLLLKYKALALGVEIKSPEAIEPDDYKGFKEVTLTKTGLSLIYIDLHKNSYDLFENEYLVVRGEESGEVEDVLMWNGEMLMPIQRRGRSDFTRNIDGIIKLKTKDVYQTMAIDSIRDNQLTLVRGEPGSGKTLLALNAAWELVEQKGYKLVIFFNPVPARGSIELGFYKGDAIDKALQSSVGSMLISKFGSQERVEDEIMLGRIELKPFVDLRGFDTTTEGGEEDTVLLITEAQNLSRDLLKMGLQRLGENTKAIIDGDISQVDDDMYLRDNGISRMSEVFRGKSLYGEVELQEIYRSPIARIAEEM